MRKAILCSVFLTGAVAAAAATDPIAARKDILKGMGDATKPVVAMLKGQAPYEQGKVDAALAAYVDGSAKAPTLFPDTSKTGGKTEALPKIWEDKARFESLFKKLNEDARATQGKIVDVASLKATFPKVLGDCKTCHDDFRHKE